MTPRVELEVLSPRGPLRVTAVLDTGFDGEVCLPTDIAVTLGLQLVARQWAEYADGRQARELVFAGEVLFIGETHPVDIVLTESEEALVGTGLLAEYTLFIDFPSGEIKIERRTQRDAES